MTVVIIPCAAPITSQAPRGCRPERGEAAVQAATPSPPDSPGCSQVASGARPTGEQPHRADDAPEAELVAARSWGVVLTRWYSLLRAKAACTPVQEGDSVHILINVVAGVWFSPRGATWPGSRRCQRERSVSYAVWLAVAVIWVTAFGGVGALLASIQGVEPVVGFALAVVAGPLGWLGIPVIRRVIAGAAADRPQFDAMFPQRHAVGPGSRGSMGRPL